MPDPLELPRMGCAIIPLMSARHAVIRELVAHRLPCLTTIARALNHLPVPAGRLRNIQPVGVSGRPLNMVNLPTRKVGPAHLPLLTLCVRSQDECSLARTN